MTNLQTTQMTTRINYDIEAGRLGYRNSGSRCTVWFVPGAEREDGIPCVTTWRCIGSGTPITVWNRRALTFGDLQDKDGASVEAILREHESALLELNSRYLGTEWDGSNHVGKWEQHDGDDRDDPEFWLLQELSDALDYAATYWDARDWIESSNVASEFAEFGGTVEDMAAKWEEEARDSGELLDAAELAEAIRAVLDDAAESDTK